MASSRGSLGSDSDDSRPRSAPPPPPALYSRNPAAWLVVFGPGAIIASITLGSGELIFSTRGGALFGYRILFLFVLISLLKWGLVFAMARHMVLSGVHPYQRMMELPGPRGWFPLMLLLIACVTTPVWTSFFPGILGNFTSWVTGTQDALNGAIDYVWGSVFLFAILIVTFAGGYSVLERIQLTIVALMMVCALVTLVLYEPNWLEMLRSALIPQRFVYPDWLQVRYPDIAENTVWVETTRYVGVIGGAGFDYLAYTAWLREKHWGHSGSGAATGTELQAIASDRAHPVRYWVRAPLVDCTLSFVLVVLFSAVFVASGVVVLGPEQQIPTEDNFLDLQARFVTSIHPWLLPIYVIGAYLTMIGSLYGTLEIGVTVCREIVRAMDPDLATRHWRRMRNVTIAWLSTGAIGLLIWSFFHTLGGGSLQGGPRVLLAILTPANLFTGVLSVGILCFVMPWMDFRFLPQGLRMPWWLVLLNVASGGIFVALGIKGYWEARLPFLDIHASRGFTIGGIFVVAALSVTIAAIKAKKTAHTSD